MIKIFQQLKEIQENQPDKTHLFPYCKIYIQNFRNWQFTKYIGTINQKLTVFIFQFYEDFLYFIFNSNKIVGISYIGNSQTNQCLLRFKQQPAYKTQSEKLKNLKTELGFHQSMDFHIEKKRKNQKDAQKNNELKYNAIDD
ncbi:unnamed protein product [Paramecium octaurelia]|nr:unnamed protein product [Paramecium octaurelia]